MKPQFWFTAKKINNKIFLIEEKKYREHANLYLIKGKTFDLLIDTGLGVCDLKKYLSPISTNLKVVNTHTHFDHMGGNFVFDEIAVHVYDKKILEHPTVLNTVSYLIKEKDFIKKPYKKFKASNFKVKPSKITRVLLNNDTIDLGGMKLEIIHTPGHTPGSICLFDKKNKILFTGDTVYYGDIHYDLPTSDNADYKKSLLKLIRLKIKIVYPGHNKILTKSNFFKTIQKIISNIPKHSS
jgi:glyoxylase-like metal-dependent hydrolase (beta-lactamase superfamily II)